LNLTGTLKLLMIVIAGIFVMKVLFGYVATKFPNTVTNAANTVVQAA